MKQKTDRKQNGGKTVAVYYFFIGHVVVVVVVGTVLKFVCKNSKKIIQSRGQDYSIPIPNACLLVYTYM